MAEGNRSKAVYDFSKILNCFASNGNHLTLKEISQHVDMFPSKVHRLVLPMVEEGILFQNKATKKYSVGQKLFEIGLIFTQDSHLISIFRPFAVELSKKLKLNVYLAIHSKVNPHHAIILDFVTYLETKSALRKITYNLPLKTTSIGKIIMAFSKEKSVTKIVEGLSMQSSSFTDQMEEIRRNEVAINKGDNIPGVWGVSAPLRDRHKLLGVINIVDKESVIRDSLDDIEREIKQTGSFLSSQLGYLAF
jgi:IclR family transcriptional regulator, KDG regulon repressor